MSVRYWLRLKVNLKIIYEIYKEVLVSVSRFFPIFPKALLYSHLLLIEYLCSVFVSWPWPVLMSVFLYVCTKVSLCYCECARVYVIKRQPWRERTGPFLLSHARLAFSILFFLLLMLERHSFSSPPKESHVFGQSGGVMHGWTRLS